MLQHKSKPGYMNTLDHPNSNRFLRPLPSLAPLIVRGVFHTQEPGLRALTALPDKYLKPALHISQVLCKSASLWAATACWE